MITVLSLIVGAFIIGLLVTAVALFINWLLHHPAHTVCKELPPRTEPCKHDLVIKDFYKIGNYKCCRCGESIDAAVTPPKPKPKDCKHERFVMDKEIRVIQCKQCGMMAWLEKDHVDLFPPKN